LFILSRQFDKKPNSPDLNSARPAVERQRFNLQLNRFLLKLDVTHSAKIETRKMLGAVSVMTTIALLTWTFN